MPFGFDFKRPFARLTDKDRQEEQPSALELLYSAYKAPPGGRPAILVEFERAIVMEAQENLPQALNRSVLAAENEIKDIHKTGMNCLLDLVEAHPFEGFQSLTHAIREPAPRGHDDPATIERIKTVWMASAKAQFHSGSAKQEELAVTKARSLVNNEYVGQTASDFMGTHGQTVSLPVARPLGNLTALRTQTQ